MQKYHDEFYMRRAIELAKKTEGKTSPNPIVGCVIVKNKRIIAEGYHEKAGLPHAEIVALNKTSNPKYATMYVTLEPCDHFGRTPPCTNAIIKSGIKKVVIAVKDPNKINNGRGIRKLKRNNVIVRLGVCKDEALKIYKPYIKFITKGLPFVTVKIAESLDGKIATRNGESKWISNISSRNYVKKLRSKVDAIMVGINTVLEDDPLLLPRNKSKGFVKRIILDSNLRLPLNSRLVESLDSSPLYVATTPKAPKKKKALLVKKGIVIFTIHSKKNKVDLHDLLRTLATLDIMHILVEGGGELVGSLFDEKLVDRAIFFISPKIVGGREALTSVEGDGIDKIGKAIKLKNIAVRRFKEDLLIEGDV